MLYISTGTKNPYQNHAIEEYLLTQKTDDVFMLWQNEPTVLLGRNQIAEEEVDLDYVNEHGIHVVRRLSGGGTIYCDATNMQYTFITTKTGDAEDHSFQKMAMPILLALQSLGLDARFHGRNDLVLGDKKISGNAQYHYKNRLLHHGTILYDASREHLAHALKPSPLKLKKKGVASVAARVGYIKEHTSISLDECIRHIESFVRSHFGIDANYEFDESERQRIDAIRIGRFEQDSWTFDKKAPPRQGISKKYEQCLLHINAQAKENVLTSLRLRGDFFGESPIDELEEALLGTPCTADALEEALTRLPLATYIRGMDAGELARDIVEASRTNPNE